MSDVTAPESIRNADVVVVGAGVGGLTAAAYLAALGRQVVVVDREAKPGGNMAAFRRDGYEWDVGLDYLGLWGEARPGVRAFLEPLGIDLSFNELDPDGVETLLFDDGSFAVPKGVEAFRARLHHSFPRERRKVDRFLKRIVTIGEELQAPLPRDPRQAAAYAWRARHALAAGAATLGGELERLDCSPRLRVVLSWKHGGSGVPPGRMALGLYALACLTHALGGLWYPQGGGQAIVDALVGVIRRHGGTVLCDTEVSRILVEQGVARGVALVPGPGGTAPAADELRAQAVVAAGDLKRTFTELLGPHEIPGRIRRRVRRYEMAAAAFVVYLILERDLRAEGWSNGSWWHVVDCDDIDSTYACLRNGQLPAQGWTGITSQSLKDPANPRLCAPGQTNMRLVTFAPPSHEFWDIGPRLERGPGYERRARQLRDRVVRHAERAIPGLADAIAYEHVATPITHERHFRSTAGTPYGIAATPTQFGLLRPGPRTPIEGLYLAGASTRSLHGISGGMLGGTETASAIAGTPVLESL